MNFYPITLESPQGKQKVVFYPPEAINLRKKGWREVPPKVPKSSNKLTKRMREA